MGIHHLRARVRVEDVHGGTLLHWLEMGSKDHLGELVVVHVLHARQLLGGVDVNSLVLPVHLRLQLLLDLFSCEKFFVENFLLLLVGKHSVFLKFNYNSIRLISI